MDSTLNLRAITGENLDVREENTEIQLRRARNKLLTINSLLPIEVLVDISRYLVPTRTDGTRMLHICRHKPKPYPACRQWAPAISHVCNHWRNVALSAPSLWI
jgi:hypothetical protein